MSCLNPLHCGAVVASRPRAPVLLTPAWPSQSPSLRGSGRFLPHGGGQRRNKKSQSPSLRGSGRFGGLPGGPASPLGASQSPSLRGSGRFRLSAGPPASATTSSQSPSLRGSGRFCLYRQQSLQRYFCFNPLHCGAVVASKLSPNAFQLGRNVSIPFIAGQWSLQRPLV